MPFYKDVLNLFSVLMQLEFSEAAAIGKLHRSGDTGPRKL